jgi:hypothetical protein
MSSVSSSRWRTARAVAGPVRPSPSARCRVRAGAAPARQDGRPARRAVACRAATLARRDLPEATPVHRRDMRLSQNERAAVAESANPSLPGDSGSALPRGQSRIGTSAMSPKHSLGEHAANCKRSPVPGRPHLEIGRKRADRRCRLLQWLVFDARPCVLSSNCGVRDAGAGVDSGDCSGGRGCGLVDSADA